MPKDDKKEFFKALKVDSYSTENEIKKAYKKLALQCHPDKNFSEGSAKKQFEELCKAFESLVLEDSNDSMKDSDKIFFDFLGDILFGTESNSNFFSFFCGSKQHCCLSSDGDPDLRYQDDYDDEDIDGEAELDSIMEIVKNRRKKGKSVPDDFHETRLQELKVMLAQHKEEMKKDGSKKQQASKKGKTTVPVAKPKPKSKKQLLAEQRRRDKEMQQIAMQLEEKRKEDEEKDKQRKQMEVERQKRLEEERIKAQNEERKRREREQKEREKQQRQEQEREERKRRQQEEEKKRKEEEEKRKKAEKEKADKEKAAKKAALQAAKEKEEQSKAANKLQLAKQRQPQQQRTDQQQYPREIPPRFQKMKKQQHLQQQQSQSTTYQTNQQPTQHQQQQNRAQVKPQQPVGKKKDPNRFASKEYAGLINEADDIGWPKGQSKGSGWIAATEDWDQESDKWGAVDRDWGGKEGTTWQKVVDRNDGNTWPAVGTKTTGDSGNSDLVISKPTSSNVNSVNSTTSSPLDSKSKNAFTGSGNTQLSTSKPQDWSSPASTVASMTLGLDTWDSACDDSIDRALDAADSKLGVTSGGVSWAGMGASGLGGLIGTPLGWDATVSSKTENTGNVKTGWVSDSNPAPPIDTISWNKTPGKGPKTKPTNEQDSNKPTATSTWGGTPAGSSSAWVEITEHSKKVENSSVHPTWESNSNSTASQSTARKNSSECVENPKTKQEACGWGDGSTAPSNWGTAPEITGTACWDNALTSSVRKVSDSKDFKSNPDKGWLENASGTAIQEKSEENVADGSWDGWTTASSKRNRAPKPAPQPSTTTDTNAWMSRSLKQLLDMGFKQEDADKALRANHMNIESAIGDLLSMTASNADPPLPTSTSTTNVSKDPDLSTDNSAQQQQPAKQNRKQRRKTQQQQLQQQPQNSVTNPPISQENKDSSEIPTTSPQPTLDVDSKTDSNVAVSKAVKPAKSTPVLQQNDKPRVLDQTNQQGPKPGGASVLPGGNSKRGTNGLMQPPTPGVPTPLRTPMSHPLLQQQLMQQYHLQLRMAGLLQSPLTPQQFALFQQMTQLRIVQQSLAQQQLNQKHGAHGVQAQQQLYQQQQQVALMLAQMQQQLLQQHPAHAARFPSPGFPQAPAPSQSAHGPAAAQGSPQLQHKSPKPSEKPATEMPPATSESRAEVSQAKDATPTSTLSLEERGKQVSPAPQSRLTQWKQPLLPDPDQPSPNGDPAQGHQWGAGIIKPETTVNISPRPNRISESVSSRWGVDASPRLSADPPEFKPGVPWRPRMDEGKTSPKEEEKVMMSSAEKIAPVSTSPPSPSKQRGNAYTDVPLSSQYPFGIGSSPWQAPGPDSLLAKSSSSSIRPPPGLDSSNKFPDKPNIEEEHSSWVKSLIDSAPPSFAQNGPTNDLNLGQMSFPLAGPSWSTQDGHPLTAPDPKPWAAPGRPAASTTPPSIVPMTTNAANVSGTVNTIPNSDVTKVTNMGISSWSVKQPIPSAEEKLSHPSVATDKQPVFSGGNAGGAPGSNAKPASGSLSTWLVLHNIPPNADINAVRNMCQQHGPLLTFQYNMRYGNSLVRYGSTEQAATMRKVLNGIAVQGEQLTADFATDSDIAAFFQQPVDWNTNPFQANSSYGNHWSAFQNSLMSGQGEPTQRPNPVPTQPASTEMEPPPSVHSTTTVPPPNMQWGNVGATPIPSQLWGTPLPGGNSGFPSQGPSMWSFGANPEPKPQSGGANDNGLVSPSMTTFLPPGLLNGGESV